MQQQTREGGDGCARPPLFLRCPTCGRGVCSVALRANRDLAVARDVAQGPGGGRVDAATAIAESDSRPMNNGRNSTRSVGRQIGMCKRPRSLSVICGISIGVVGPLDAWRRWLRG